MNIQPAIITQQLSRRFGNTLAVDQLTFDVAPGEIFGLLGHNGAGKTTTIRLLNGVLAPSAGGARVLDFDPELQGPALRHHTGVLTETPALDERLTGRENLTMYGRLYGLKGAELEARVTELLATFELSDWADERAGSYSKGMKQRLALARLLVHDPAVLFLDEPTAGLDPLAARHVHELIQQLSQTGQRTIVLCTHNLAEAEQLCHRVAVLERGRLMALGAPAELARSLWQGVRLEIELGGGSRPALLAAWQGRPGLSEVSWADGVLQLRVSGRDMIPDLVAELVAQGERLYRVTPCQPTLEDVYFALHGQGVTT